MTIEEQEAVNREMELRAESNRLARDAAMIESLRTERDKLRRERDTETSLRVQIAEARVHIERQNREIDNLTKQNQLLDGIWTKHAEVIGEVLRWLNEGATLTATVVGSAVFDGETLSGVTVNGAQTGIRVTSEEVPRTYCHEEAVKWNPYNEVVQDHRDGTIIQPDTDIERAKRGLPPFTPDPGPHPLNDPVAIAEMLERSKESLKEWDEQTALRLKRENDSAAFTRVIGQAWCAAREVHPDSPEILDLDRRRLVLCAIHQDVTTGETSYVPISFDDLPRVPETPAS